jgi:hypothetical protein
MCFTLGKTLTQRSYSAIGLTLSEIVFASTISGLVTRIYAVNLFLPRKSAPRAYHISMTHLPPM